MVASERKSLLPPEGMKRREGAAAASARGTPLSKVAVIEVASVMTAEELSTP